MNEAKIKSIEKSLEIQKDRDLRRIKALQRHLLLAKREQILLKDILDIQIKIFQYDSTRFANREINPDAYYRSSIALKNHKYGIFKSIQNIQKLKDQLADLLKL